MNLTDEEIRIQVAEACEWLKQHHTVSGRSVWRKNGITTNEGWNDHWFEELPNYPESLDACAEFEKTLTDAEQPRYALNLWEQLTGAPHIFKDSFKFATATARQRCLAYLKTKELIP